MLWTVSNPVAIAESANLHIENPSPIDSVEYIKDRIKTYSETYGVSEEVMNVVVACESQYNHTTQSFVPDPTGPNSREDSWGLVQIHLPSHPNITKDQAVEIEFSLNFLADNLSKDNGRIGICWRMFYGSKMLPLGSG